MISRLVFSVRMTVPWQCTVQPMSGVSAMFILDDRCNLPLYQLTVQSISHYFFQTISSWLRFTRHHYTLSPSDIMYGCFSKAPMDDSKYSKSVFCNNFKRFLIEFHTLICLLFIFILSPTPKSFSPPSLSFFAIIHFFPGQRQSRLCSCDLLSIRGLKINYAGSHA